jgi:hypothetical protein
VNRLLENAEDIEEIKCNCNKPFGHKLFKEAVPELYAKKTGIVTCKLCMDEMKGCKCDCGEEFCNDCLRMY